MFASQPQRLLLEELWVVKDIDLHRSPQVSSLTAQGWEIFNVKLNGSQMQLPFNGYKHTVQLLVILIHLLKSTRVCRCVCKHDTDFQHLRIRNESDLSNVVTVRQFMLCWLAPYIKKWYSTSSSNFAMCDGGNTNTLSENVKEFYWRCSKWQDNVQTVRYVTY